MYDELVKRLREPCQYENCILCQQAAVVIEELMRRCEQSAQPTQNNDSNALDALDCVSRQAAIDALGDEPEVWTGKDEYAQGLNNQWHYDRNAIKAVPPAQLERKKGKWKEKMLDHFRKYEAVCSECGARYIGNYDSYDEPDEFNYCPNCGAKMDEVEE